MAQWLARIRDERAEVTENDCLLVGHLAGALAANDLLATRIQLSAMETVIQEQRVGALR